MALPFILYGGVLRTLKRREWPEIWNDAPFFKLSATGVALVTIALVLAVSIGTNSPGSKYVPSQIVDGQIKHGKFEDNSKKPALAYPY
jgi:hypothetical protein